MSSTQPIAAIDIGSNSIHMVIAKVDATGHLQILDTEKVTLRLGSALDRDNNLPLPVIDHVIKTLEQFKSIAKSFEATLRVVATHAIREANNSAEILNQAKKILDMDIEIIDGAEEARLCYLGVKNSLVTNKDTHLNIDIGGGSTEITVWNGNQILHTASLKIGAVTLTKQLEPHFPNPDQYREELERFVLVRLAPISTLLDGLTIKKAIASSGTAKTLASLHSHQKGKGPITDINGYEITAKSLAQISTQLMKLHEPQKIREAFEIDTGRSEIICAGAAILKTVTAILNIDSWHISSFALREGLVFDTFERLQPRLIYEEQDIRWNSIINLGRRFTIDEQQGSAVSDLSSNVYEQLQSYTLPDITQNEHIENMNLIRSAGYLHEIGKSISHPKHHHHAAYIISNASLLGFTQIEKSMVSAIIRFCRKRGPNKEKLKAFGLKERQFKTTKILSACLRIANSLCRTRRNLVKRIEINDKNSILQLIVFHDKDQQPSAEFWKLVSEKRHLEKALGKQLNFILRSEP